MLDHVTNEKLVSNAFMLASQAFDNLLRDGKASEQVALTLYALFKQINSGNADEFEDNKTKTDPAKYAVWLQQLDKSGVQCMKEYIILVGQCDIQFMETVKGVSSGRIEEINIQEHSSGNPLAPVVPLPSKPDDSEYLDALKGKDKKMHELYEEI